MWLAKKQAMHGDSEANCTYISSRTSERLRSRRKEKICCVSAVGHDHNNTAVQCAHNQRDTHPHEIM